jgi:hypothetical protein
MMGRIEGKGSNAGKSVLDLKGKEAEQGKGEERSGAERNERVEFRE